MRSKGRASGPLPFLLALAMAVSPPALADEEGAGDPLPALTAWVEESGTPGARATGGPYADGVRALRSGDDVGAALALGEAALSYPADPRPHLLQALALAGLPRFDLASRAARRAFAARAAWGKDDIDLALILGEERKLDYVKKVKPALEESLGEPPDEDMEFLLALVFVAAGDRAAAKDRLEAVLARSRDHVPARQLLATWPEAERGALFSTATGPDGRPDDAMVRGYHLLRLGEYRRAAGAFAEASVLDPGASLPRIEMGHALFAASRYTEAGAALLEALPGEPQWSARNLDLYDRFARADELDLRIEELEGHAREHPEDLDSLFLYAYTLHFTDRAVLAVPLFELLQKSRPQDAVVKAFLADARARAAGSPPDPANPDPEATETGAGTDPFEAGTRAFRQGEYRAALDRFQEAVRTRPSVPQRHFWFALARFAGGLYAEAGRAFREGMSHVQDWKNFAFDWQGSYGGSKDFDLHFAGLEKHVKAHPSDSEARLFLGVLLMAKKDYTNAMMAFEQNVQADREKQDTLSAQLLSRARSEARPEGRPGRY
ncbi:MAG: tetratricopeptide repeat protein [Planctomycetes bacterium]|nr:tetratricopeptide repeat protein [Planctomycetota bacterium]